MRTPIWDGKVATLPGKGTHRLPCGPSRPRRILSGELLLGVSSHDRVGWAFAVKRRGSQVVRRGSAKAVCVGSIPTLASLSNLLEGSNLRRMNRPLSVKMSV